MSVRDNVIVAHHLRSQRQPARLLPRHRARPGRTRPNSARSADEILEFLGLSAFATRSRESLPQGHLRALGIAIGLATNPKVLLLDEPFAGMNHEETMQAVDLVRGVARPRRHRPAGRARHAGGDADLRPHRRAQFRRRRSPRARRPRSSSNEKVIEAYLGIEDEAIGL